MKTRRLHRYDDTREHWAVAGTRGVVELITHRVSGDGLAMAWHSPRPGDGEDPDPERCDYLEGACFPASDCWAADEVAKAYHASGRSAVRRDENVIWAELERRYEQWTEGA